VVKPVHSDPQPAVFPCQHGVALADDEIGAAEIAEIGVVDTHDKLIGFHEFVTIG
jgi:hypothetical protein